LKDLGVQILKE